MEDLWNRNKHEVKNVKLIVSITQFNFWYNIPRKGVNLYLVNSLVEALNVKQTKMRE